MVSIGDEIRKYIFKEIKVTRIIFLKESTTIFKKKQVWNISKEEKKICKYCYETG